MRVLFVDAYNLMHRARWGYAKGDYNIVYTFFRGIRPIVERFSPDKVYFVLEGKPVERLELYPEYKANRRTGLTPEKVEQLSDFKRQKEIICDLIRYLPFVSVYHPEYEADDVIANLIIHSHADDECIIASNDTDFIQIHDSHKNVSLYSPVDKNFREPVDYDYVAWKAFVGDASDNIKGVPRIGKKTASTILKSDLNVWLAKNPEKAEIFHRNVELIRFADLGDRLGELVRLELDTDFDLIRDRFNEMEFYSITNEKSWKKYVDTFEKLRGMYV